MKIFHPSGIAEMSLSPEFLRIYETLPTAHSRQKQYPPHLARSHQGDGGTDSYHSFSSSLDLSFHPSSTSVTQDPASPKNLSWPLPRFLPSEQRDLHCARSLAASEHPAHGRCWCLSRGSLPGCSLSISIPRAGGPAAPNRKASLAPGTERELLQRVPTAWELALNGLRVSRRQECGECSTAGQPTLGD